MGRTVKRVNRQTGNSKYSKDKPLKALKPGHRISSRGKRYYEARKNRSDLFGNI